MNSQKRERDEDENTKDENESNDKKLKLDNGDIFDEEFIKSIRKDIVENDSTTFGKPLNISGIKKPAGQLKTAPSFSFNIKTTSLPTPPENITTNSETIIKIADSLPSNTTPGPPKPNIAPGPPKPNTAPGPPKPNTTPGPPKPNTTPGPPKPNTTPGPPKPNTEETPSSDSDSDLSDEEIDEEKEEVERWVQLAKSIPITNEVVMKSHNKILSSISIDPSGSRMLTGSFDCKVRFWDFNSMDTSLKSFREIEPYEGTQVRQVVFSPKGDRFLVVPYTTTFKVYDRDGFNKGESVTGDRYIQDLNHTKGHVSILNNACWHPDGEESEVISSSIDGTIRVWDLNSLTKNKSVIKSRPATGSTRIGVTNCCYDLRGDIISAGCADGIMTLFDKRSSMTRPKTTLTCHSESITSICYNRDGIHMATRSLDHTMKLWDLRSLESPLQIFEDLPCEFLECNATFASFDRLLVTGTSAAEKGGFGTVVFYDVSSLTKMRQIKVEGSSVVNVQWSEKINQIFLGCADGDTRILYDSELSQKGIRLSVAKAPRAKRADDYIPQTPIYAPNMLPLFRQANIKQKHITDYSASTSIKPKEIKQVGLGKNQTQNLIQKMGLVQNDTSWKEDAREAFLSKDNSKKSNEKSDNDE